jgi:hypothetical protein
MSDLLTAILITGRSLMEKFSGDRRKFGGARARAVFSRLLSDQVDAWLGL